MIIVEKNMKVDLYCRRCRKSLHISYKLTGDPQSPVLPNITLKCGCCTRVMMLRNFKEHHILEHLKDNKYYL